MTRTWLTRGLVVLGLVGAVACGSRWVPASQVSFDKLSDADRKAFQERFIKEVWPLMQRNGKDGCVGCHSTGKIVSALKLTGNAEKDFQKLLRDGFFLYGDEGSLLARVTEKDVKRRMPLDQKPWTAAEIKVLHDFTKDLDSKQKK